MSMAESSPLLDVTPTIQVGDVPNFDFSLAPNSSSNHVALSLTADHLGDKPSDVYQKVPSAHRQDLRTFLSSSLEGQLILYHYEKHDSLSDMMLNNLTRLVVNREIQVLMQSENVSLNSPLQKLEISSKNLKRVAEEINIVFKERAGTFYTPGRGDKDHRVGPSGKLIGRVNYMRKILIGCGILKYVDRGGSCNSQVPLDSESKLTVLRENTAEWSMIEKAWTDTFILRQQLMKKKTDKGLWEFSEFHCLATSKGPALLIADYNTKYPNNNIEIDKVWESLRGALHKFIESKKLNDEVKAISKLLTNSSKGNEDAIILMLLPYALKAPSLPAAKKSSNLASKRQKIETETTLQPEQNYQEKTFILHVNIAADLDKKIEEQHNYLSSVKERPHPFMVFVGPLSSLEAFYVVIDKVRYKTNSPLDALDLTFRIFFACNFEYPKSMHQTWLFFQKLCYCLNIRTDKCSTFLNKALTFFEKELNIQID